MRISDWSSDVCSSDLKAFLPFRRHDAERDIARIARRRFDDMRVGDDARRRDGDAAAVAEADDLAVHHRDGDDAHDAARRSADITGGAGRKDVGEEGEQQGEQITDERRDGKECVNKCRYRLWLYS